MQRKWISLICGEKYVLQERLFILVVVVMTLSYAFFVLTNAITGANIWNIVILTALLALLGFIALFSLRRKHIRAGASVISAISIYILLPVMFFSGGGIYGGPPIWFIFSALFVSLILTGKTKLFFLISDMAVAGICYILAYSNPGLVQQNTTVVAYIDSYAALFFISLAVCVMVSFETELYKKENLRAERQKREIEALNDAQNRFFSSMSHEIRTPINTIIGLNEMILREDVSEEVAEDATNIQAASRMLLHLINDILDMSKLESGNMQLSPVIYRVGDMLSELVGMFWLRAGERGLDFHVSVASDVPAELVGDDVRIKQILINVLNNAVKYTAEGSVTLSIQCGKREGDIQHLIFSVSDTGIGIKKENIPYLFTAFKRMDEDKNRRIEGTGLGLSIVKQLVDLMGGTITVNSVYTQGSTFIIELPQQVSGEETVDTKDLEERSSTSRSTYRARYEAPEAAVLVVDDNASNLLVVSKLLRGTRAQVETASSGAEALRKTQEKEYHVIFLDHLMPEMDGVECRRRILAQTGGKCRGAKIVVLTANADRESREMYEREGFDGYLAKPVDGVSLEKELYRHLPSDMVHTFASEDADLLKESIAWIQAPQRKRMVAIATESVVDLPEELIKQYEIETLPHLVLTKGGVFRDTLELESNGLLSYMSASGDHVRTQSPDVAAHESFFAQQLKYSNNVVYITLSSKVENSAFFPAKAAAASFDNVTVVDSGHLSSGQGLLVLEACRMAEEGKTPVEIVKRLAELSPFVHTSFIVDNLDYLSRSGQVKTQIARITKALTLRPVVVMRNGRMTVGRVFFGQRMRAWRKYIEACFKSTSEIDTRTLFITYAGVSWKDLRWIEEEVKKYVHFDTVYFQKASAAIVVNCGPASFGLLYRKKERSTHGG